MSVCFVEHRQLQKLTINHKNFRKKTGFKKQLNTVESSVSSSNNIPKDEVKCPLNGLNRLKIAINLNAWRLMRYSVAKKHLCYGCLGDNHPANVESTDARKPTGLEKTNSKFLYFAKKSKINKPVNKPSNDHDEQRWFSSWVNAKSTSSNHQWYYCLLWQRINSELGWWRSSSEAWA